MDISDLDDHTVANYIVRGCPVSHKHVSPQAWLLVLEEIYTARPIAEKMGCLFTRIRDLHGRQYVGFPVPKARTKYVGEVRASTKARMAQLGNIRGDLPSSPGEVKQRSGGFLLLLQPEKIGGRLTFAYWSLVYELTLLSDIKGFRHDTIISSQVNTLGESEVIGILKDYPNVVFSFLDLADWVGQEAKQAMDKAVSLLAFAQKVRDMEQRLRS